MKNLIKINKLLLNISLLLLGVALFVVIYAQQHSLPNIQCSAYIEQFNKDEDYIMKSTFIFSFRKDGTGLISTDGIVYYNDKEYVMRRDAKVAFHHLNNNMWEFTSMQLFKNGSDTTPNEIVERYFYSMNSEASHYFTLKKINDYWLIGSLRSPSFLCR